MNSYRFFQNRECEYFPCHKGVPADEFNCLFCYCPLYALGNKCGGGCTYDSEGNKDCSGCTYPHLPANYDGLIDRCGAIIAMARRPDAE